MCENFRAVSFSFLISGGIVPWKSTVHPLIEAFRYGPDSGVDRGGQQPPLQLRDRFAGKSIFLSENVTTILCF